MPTTIGSLRRLLMTPKLVDVTFAARGFPGASSPAATALEAVPQSVICGFEWGIDARDQWELERRLALVDEQLRGFAYEGATMACTVLDATGPRRGTRTRDLLDGPGAPHLFLAYIGIGFAMARLPRPLWRKVVPDLVGSPYHPTMTWLAVDGYGFDRAYFDTTRIVDRQERLSPYPWQGHPEYFPRAVDQGIGRALWFIHGARPDDVATAVDRFASARQPDLWSGVGLAATFAGGSDGVGYGQLRRLAGAFLPDLSQGAVFAVKARVQAGYVPEHTETALAAFGLPSARTSAVLADDVAVHAGQAGGLPAYEIWRRDVRAHFLTAVTSPDA